MNIQNADPAGQPATGIQCPRQRSVREARMQLPLDLLAEKPWVPDDDWGLSYADIMTQLIVMFVLVFSFAHFDKPGSPLPSRAQSPDAIVNIAPISPPAPAAETLADSWHEGPAGHGDASQRAALRSSLQALAGDKNYVVNYEDRAIEVQTPDAVFFPSGRAQLSEQGTQAIDVLLPLLRAGAFEIEVEGHADSQPMSSLQYPSNWELSSARASAVVRYLEAMGISSDRMRVVAFSNTHPRMRDTSVAAQARNRRVCLRLLLNSADIKP